MNRAEELIREWFEGVWTPEHQIALADTLCHPDFRLVGIGPDKSLDEFRQMHAQLTARIPDIRIEVERTWGIGDDTVAHHSTVSGTHVSGKPIRFGGVGVLRIENEVFVETRESWDLLEMFHALGEVSDDALLRELLGPP